jgi:hypothetical protein
MVAVALLVLGALAAGVLGGCGTSSARPSSLARSAPGPDSTTRIAGPAARDVIGSSEAPFINGLASRYAYARYGDPPVPAQLSGTDRRLHVWHQL